MLLETVRRQAGVVTRRQALRAGLTDSAIRQRVLSGRWQRLFPGVFACFSGPVSRPALMWAAVLFCGPGAVLSHESAAELYGIVAEPTGPVHVSVPRSRRVTRYPDLIVHRSTRAEPSRHPVLEPPRTRVEDTIVDLTRSASDPESAIGWLMRGVNSRLTTASRLRAAVTARTRVRWRRPLLAALQDVAEGCHSLLEIRYKHRVERAHGLPAGVRQQRRERWRDDVTYRGHRLMVELDGRVAHPVDRAFRDHRRDNAAVLAGSVVLRYGYSDITERPCAVAREVGTVLRAAGWPGRPRPCAPECVVSEAA